MHLKYESQIREPLVDGNKDYHQVTEDIIRPIEAKAFQTYGISVFISLWLCCCLVFTVFIVM